MMIREGCLIEQHRPSSCSVYLEEQTLLGIEASIPNNIKAGLCAWQGFGKHECVRELSNTFRLFEYRADLKTLKKSKAHFASHDARPIR
jgi:hypothetical protein